MTERHAQKLKEFQEDLHAELTRTYGHRAVRRAMNAAVADVSLASEKAAIPKCT